MAARSRRSGSAPWPRYLRAHPVLVLAFDTWRLAWREAMTRVELAMLVILAVISGVAAVGSPSAGDGAIQMLAVCLSVVPFGLVLVAGQIWRHPNDETALFTRSLDALTYVGGRALGLFAVGLAMLTIIDVVGSLALTGIASLPLAGSLSWDTAFSAFLALPGLIVIIGGALLLISLTGGGSRYYTLAILLSLLVAFGEYKLPSLTSLLGPETLLLSPFPGLLTLGLALPPALLPAHPGWLWLNRGIWIAAGVGFLALTAWIRGHRRETPLQRERPLRWALSSAVVAVLAMAGGLVANAAVWAPPQLPKTVVTQAADAAPALPPGSFLRLNVTVSPSSSVLGGTAILTSGPAAVPGRLAFWLNTGLTVTQVTVNGKPAVFQRLGGGAVGTGTAAGLWEVLGALPSRAAIAIAYYGTLAPEPTWIPAPPFVRGGNYEGAFLDPARLFLDGAGTWYPRFLAHGEGGAPLYTPATMVLALEGAMPSAVTANLAVSGFQARFQGPAALPQVIWMAGPFRRTLVDGVPVYTAHPVSASAVAAYGTYAAALKAVEPWLPVRSRGPLAIVRSPLASIPLMAGGTLAAPENQPFCTPVDPVSGQCGSAPPTAETAYLRIAVAGWENGLGMPDPNLPALAPVYAAGDERGALLAPLAAVTAWRGARGTSLAPAIAAGWEKGTPLPVLGTLTPSQRAEAAILARWSEGATATAWRQVVNAIEALAARPLLTWRSVSALVGRGS
jgi:hypothetical protein